MASSKNIGDVRVEWIDGKFGKYTKISKGERWLNISEKAWLVIVENAKAIEEIIKSEDGGIFDFAENGHVEIKDYREKRYVGFKLERASRDGKVFVNRMNFDTEGWKAMLVFVEGTVLKNKKRKSSSVGKKTKKAKKMMTQYTWQSEKTLVEGPVTSPYWFFTEELCRTDAAILKDDDVLILMRDVPMVPLEDVVGWLTTFIVTNAIRAKMVENCSRCRIDHPSQLQHMSMGCLSEWEDAVEVYFDEASHIAGNQMEESCEKVLEHLPYALDDVVQKEAQKEDILEHQIPDDYDNLFRIVL